MGRKRKNPSIQFTEESSLNKKKYEALSALKELSDQTKTFDDTDHEILNEICNQIVPSQTSKPSLNNRPVSINDENVKDYVYAKTAELIESTMNIITSLQQTLVNTAADPKELLALSALVKSAASALKNMNDINLQIRQSETQKDIKQMEIEAGLAIKNNSHSTNVTNNYVIATREEMMEKLLERIKNGSSPRAALSIQESSAVIDNEDSSEE